MIELIRYLDQVPEEQITYEVNSVPESHMRYFSFRDCSCEDCGAGCCETVVTLTIGLN